MPNIGRANALRLELHVIVDNNVCHDGLKLIRSEESPRAGLHITT